MIKLAPWTPDQPAFEGPGVVDVTNVLPIGDESYGPIASLIEQANALGSRCQGAGTFRGIGGTIVNFAFDATKAYSFDGTAWSDVTRSGGDYSVDALDAVSLNQYGDFVVALNGTDTPQVWTIASSSEFADLTGSPPVGRFGGVVGPHFVIARITSALNKLAWCGASGLTSWTAGTDLSDEQEMFVGGKIMGFIGGQYGVVLCERAIHRMNYVGADPVMTFDPVSLEMGCAAEGSVAFYLQNIVFLTWDGFYLLTQGQTLTPIGKSPQKGSIVDRFFWGDVNQSFLNRITASIDPLLNVYMVSYPSIASTDGTPDKTLFFNLTTGRWSKGNFGIELLFSLRTQTGYNTDTIDSVIGNTDATMYSVDTALFSGSGRATIAAFSPTSHKLATFSGPNLEAIIETQEAEISAGRRTKLTGIRPIGDGGTLSVALGYRNRINDMVTWTGYSAQNAIGVCPFRNSARYHRARVKQAAGGNWNHLQGIDPLGIAEGMR